MDVFEVLKCCQKRPHTDPWFVRHLIVSKQGLPCETLVHKILRFAKFTS